MDDGKAVLFLSNEELLMLGVLAIEGFKTSVREHVIGSQHDIGRLAKYGALVVKIEAECNKSSDESVARFTAGESDAR